MNTILKYIKQTCPLCLEYWITYKSALIIGMGLIIGSIGTFFVEPPPSSKIVLTVEAQEHTQKIIDQLDIVLTKALSVYTTTGIPIRSKDGDIIP